MIVLFSITMLCFFALFGMLVILLRQAKAEGARERSRRRLISGVRRRERRPMHQLDPVGETGAGAGFPLQLSSLVPGKQPDWRFMVRDDRRAAGSRSAPSVAAELSAVGAGARKSVSRVDLRFSRADRAFFNADLGDLRDPPAASQANTARRA